MPHHRHGDPSTSDAPEGGEPPASGCLGVPRYPEIRPENERFNRNVDPPDDKLSIDWPGHLESFRPYFVQVTGGCGGTTEQILEWGAVKWGFDQIDAAGPDGVSRNLRDLGKAMAVNESWWRADARGDDGMSWGLLQIHSGWWPVPKNARKSSSLAVDYTFAVLRYYWDGQAPWVPLTAGNLAAVLCAYNRGTGLPDWDCGNVRGPEDPRGQGGYPRRTVFHLDNKPWRNPGEAPYYF